MLISRSILLEETLQLALVGLLQRAAPVGLQMHTRTISHATLKIERERLARPYLPVRLKHDPDDETWRRDEWPMSAAHEDLSLLRGVPVAREMGAPRVSLPQCFTRHLLEKQAHRMSDTL